MIMKSEAHNSLSSFVDDVGIPSQLHSDDAKELCKGEMKKKMNKFNIFHTMTEPYSPWENYAEDCIRILKIWFGGRGHIWCQDRSCILGRW